MQAQGRRELQVDAHTVCKKACLFQKDRVCPGNRFYMDIAVKMVDLAELLHRLVNQVHSIVGAYHNPRA